MMATTTAARATATATFSGRMPGTRTPTAGALPAALFSSPAAERPAGLASLATRLLTVPCQRLTRKEQAQNRVAGIAVTPLGRRHAGDKYDGPAEVCRHRDRDRGG